VALRDATLISVLAYAGLRPGEALGLRWGDVREHTILVERAVSMGRVGSTKTGRTRTVTMFEALKRDLAEWRLASGRPGDDDLVFPRTLGGPWTEGDWRNWRRRVFRPAVTTAGLDASLRPYDLRHSFCSLLLAEGRSVVEVARSAGHSSTMTLSTYAHLIAEYEGSGRISAEDEIRSARENPAARIQPGLATSHPSKVSSTTTHGTL
jgi:integrase